MSPPAGVRRPRAIGYWIDRKVLSYNAKAREFSAAALELPDPRRLLEVCGPQTVDPRAVTYLRAGKRLYAELGFAYCRFDCGIPDSALGCRDLTDGVWVWPEGLYHYVETHQVPLPDAFLTTMAEHQWQVPDVATDELVGDDTWLDFWKQWYEERLGGPGNPPT